MRGGRRRPIVSRESSIGHAAAKRQRGSVVGRLLDTFDKDARGVSAPQHVHKLVSLTVSRNYGMFERIIGTGGDRRTALAPVVGANRV